MTSMSLFECYEVSVFIDTAGKCEGDEHLMQIEQAIALLEKVHRDV